LLSWRNLSTFFAWDGGDDQHQNNDWPQVESAVHLTHAIKNGECFGVKNSRENGDAAKDQRHYQQIANEGLPEFHVLLLLLGEKLVQKLAAQLGLVLFGVIRIEVVLEGFNQLMNNGRSGHGLGLSDG
jgi:hypothetical protein